MATRGAIAVYDPSVGVRAIYCHWDMYPDHVGHVLVRYYNSRERAEALVALGHLSTLAPTLDGCERGSGWDEESPWQLPWIDFIDKARYMHCQFVYLWDTEDAAWSCWGLEPTEVDLTKYEENLSC